MATVQARNYKKAYVDEPSQMYDIGFNGGTVHVLIDDIQAPTAADVVEIGKLPKGAKILSVNHIGFGTSPVFNISPMDLLTEITKIEVTVGATPSAGKASAWVTYTVA